MNSSFGFSLRKRYSRAFSSFLLTAFFLSSLLPKVVISAPLFQPPLTQDNQIGDPPTYQGFHNQLPAQLPPLAEEMSEGKNEANNEGKNGEISGRENEKKSGGKNGENNVKIENKERGEEANKRVFSSSFLSNLSSLYLSYFLGSPSDLRSNRFLLLTYQSYLHLLAEVERKKRKLLLKNEKDFLLKKKNLLAKLQQFLKSLKNKFQTKLNNYQSLKNGLNSKLKAVKEKITHLSNQLNQRISLKQRLQQALANFNYFQRKEKEHRLAYDRERREYKHNKKKYKKYKKKYKKKHKKKYKKRYKKYKKRYKAHKDRARREREKYNSYEKKKIEQARLYNQLRQQLARLDSVSNQLNSLKQEESVLQANLNNLVSPVYNNELAEEAKRKYQEDLVSLTNIYQNKQREIETNYQEDLKKTKVYQDNLDYLFAHSPLVFLTREERKNYLKELYQSSLLAKKEAEVRIDNRYQKTMQIAETVFKGLVKNSLLLLNALKAKVSEAKQSLDKMKRKVKDLKEAYQENRKYKKKVKKYAKKIKKYLKKVKKYRHNRKKYKKYNNKLSSARKKYRKYLKKYLKYGSLKKAYQQSYQSAKNILKQYEEQFNLLVQEQQQAQREYQASLKEAQAFKDSLIKQARQERAVYQKQLSQAVLREEYEQIANKDNSDLDYYLSLIPATISPQTIASSFNLDFSLGLSVLSKLKDSLQKLKKKAKKAYRKAEKKAKKRREEQRRREQARRETQRRAYYTRLKQEEKRKQEWERRDQETNRFKNKTAGVWFDSHGNGYSGYYSKEEGYSKTKPVYLGYNPNSQNQFSQSNYCSTQQTKTPWYQKLFGVTAWASTTNSYQPKKGWLGKVKDIAKNSWDNFKAHPVKSILRNTWNTTKWLPPVAIGRGIGWGGKLWYDSYRSKDTFDKVHQIVNTVSGATAVTSLSMGTTGIGVVPAVVTTAVGSISDLISSGMYLMKGDWKKASFMATGAVPVFGDIMQVGRVVKYGVEEVGVARGVGRVGDTLTKEGKFYEWFAKAGYEQNFEKMTRYRGFERIEDYKFIESALNVEKSTLEGSRTSVFYNKTTKKFILTSGGTRVTKLGDWFDDFKNVFGFKSKQHKAARELAEIIKNSSNKIQAVVGHSLGGAKAKIIGLPNGIKTYTFNTAFAHKRWLDGAIGESIDFVKTGDALTYLQTESLLKKIFPKQFGKIIKYGESHWNMLPKYNLRSRVLKFVYGIHRHGIN